MFSLTKQSFNCKKYFHLPKIIHSILDNLYTWSQCSFSPFKQSLLDQSTPQNCIKLILFCYPKVTFFSRVFFFFKISGTMTFPLIFGSYFKVWCEALNSIKWKGCRTEISPVCQVCRRTTVADTKMKMALSRASVRFVCSCQLM